MAGVGGRRVGNANTRQAVHTFSFAAQEFWKAAMASQPSPPQHGTGDLLAFSDKEFRVVSEEEAAQGPVIKFRVGRERYMYNYTLTEEDLPPGYCLWRCEKPAHRWACKEGDKLFICSVPLSQQVGAARYMAMHAPEGTQSVAKLLKHRKKIFGSKADILLPCQGAHEWMSWNETGSCWDEMGMFDATILEGPRQSSATQTSTSGYLERMKRKVEQ